jgi:HemY protein
MIGLIRSMMLKPSSILFIFFGTVLMVLAFAELVDDPGYVLLTAGRYTLETSVIVALLGVVIIVRLWTWLYRLGEWVLDIKSRQKQARKRTTKGLIALAEGNWTRAEKLLAKAAEHHEVPLVNYLSAAQAAHEQGQDDRRDEYLRKAHESTKGVKGVDVAIGLTKARLQFASKRWEQCIATLMMLRQQTQSPSYPYVLKMTAEVFVQLQDWENLRDILPELGRLKLFSEHHHHQLLLDSHAGVLRNSGRQGSNEERLQQVERAWEAIPKKLKTEPVLIRAYCVKLIDLGASVSAEAALIGYLRRHWDESLVQLYGVVEGEDVQKQVIMAEAWLKERPNNAVLLLALGRLSLRSHQWDKARHYFEASLASRKTAEAYGELGRLLSRLGEHEQSNDCFQRGLAMIAERLPDLPLPTLRAGAEV